MSHRERAVGRVARAELRLIYERGTMRGSSADECVEHADDAKPENSSQPKSRSFMAHAYHEDRAVRRG